MATIAIVVIYVAFMRERILAHSAIPYFDQPATAAGMQINGWAFVGILAVPPVDNASFEIN